MVSGLSILHSFPKPFSINGYKYHCMLMTPKLIDSLINLLKLRCVFKVK